MKNHIIFLNCIIFLLLLNAKGQTQTVTIVSDITQICNGSSVTFTASENFNPMDNNLYPIGTEWEVSHDGGVSFANIPGQYQSTFTTSSLLNNDEVRAKSRYFSFSDYSQFEIISNQIQVQVNSSPKADINTISTANSGSIKFNGSNQYLTLSNPLNYSTDAFTIDGWFRLDAPPANVAPIIGAEGYGNPSVLIQSNLNTIVIDVYQHHGDFFTVPTITIGAWHHLVVVRNSSSDLTVFLDGQRSSTGAITESFSFTSTDNANVGKFQGNFLNGFLSNLRIVTGSALYDPTQTTITVPTSLTTVVANTNLLLNAINASSLLTDASGTQSSITNNGDASWSGGSPFVVNLNSSSNATISNATVGGAWSSSDNSILQVNTSGQLTPIATGNATITYTVTSNAPFTCVSTESSLFSVLMPPSTPPVNVVNNCNGTSTLSTTASGTLLWSTNESTSSIIVSNAGTYTVTQTVNGITSESGSGVAAPKTSNTSDTTASACGSFVWYGQTYTTSGTPTHTFTNVNGCDSVVTLHLTINALPTPTFISSPSTTCLNSDVTYTTQSGQASYSWRVAGTAGVDYNITSGGLSSSSNTVTLKWLTAGSKNVSVNYTDQNGCTSGGIDIPTNGLVGYWPFTGNANDATSGGHNGELRGTTLPALITDRHGNTNSAYAFTAGGTIPNHIYVGRNVLSNFSQMAVSLWFKTGSTTASFPLSSGNNNEYNIQINPNGKILTGTYHCNNGTVTNGVYVYTESSNAYNDNSWHHAVLVYDGSYNKLYVDGVFNSQVQNTSGTTTPGCASNANYSDLSFSSYYLYGDCYPLSSTEDLDDIAIYNRALSANEVADLYNAQNSEINGGATSTTTVSIANSGDTTATACGSFVWYGQTYTTSGTPTHTFTNVNGCDSVVTLHLTIKTPTSSTETITACGSYSWHGASYTASTNSVALGDSYQGGKVAYILQPGDQGYNANTVKGFIVPITSGGQIGSSDFGCNSTLVNGANGSSIGSGNQNTIDILNGCSGASAAESCNSYAVTENNIVYDDWYLPSRDEMHQIALNSNLFGGLQPWFYWTSTQTNNSQAYCVITQGAPTDAIMGKGFDAYRLPIRNFSVAKPPTWTGTNAAGCDSVVTLHLTINNSTSSVETISSSVAYVWHGVTYASSTNTPTWNTTNAAGCDSVVTLHLTITCSPNTGDTTATACGSFVWYGQTYTTSGTPTHTFTNVNGCDSVVTLHLTINAPTSSTEVISACVNYVWNGVTYSTSGTRTWNGTNAAGCDSLATLILTISTSGTYPPFGVVQKVVSNVCSARVYRYTASVNVTGTTYNWILPTSIGGVPGVTVDSGDVNSSRTLLVRYTSNEAAFITDSIKVRSFKGCASKYTAVKLTNIKLSVPSVPASITVTSIGANICFNRTYRFTAPALPTGINSSNTTILPATGYLWSLVGNLSEFASIDSGNENSQKIVVSFSNNVAAVTGDSIKLQYLSSCGNSNPRALKLTNTKLNAPLAPSIITISTVQTNVCGARKYRYTAPNLPVATTNNGAATGYVWSLVGALSGSATIDSGEINSQKIVVTFTSNATAATGDSIRLHYTSDCGNGVRKAIKLTNTLLSAPSAPASITMQTKSDVCNARTYRYIAPAVLPIATTTAGAANGYLWSTPTGTVGSTGTIDSGEVTSRIITVTYSSNAAAGVGDSIRLLYTSLCGDGKIKAQKLSNLVKNGCTPIAKNVSTSKVPNTLPTSMEVNVYPNPTTSLFNVQVKSASTEEVVVRVLDLTGRFIKSVKVSSNSSLSVGSDLKAGAYMLEVKQGKEVKIVRVVKFK